MKTRYLGAALRAASRGDRRDPAQASEMGAVLLGTYVRTIALCKDQDRVQILKDWWVQVQNGNGRWSKADADPGKGEKQSESGDAQPGKDELRTNPVTFDGSSTDGFKSISNLFLDAGERAHMEHSFRYHGKEAESSSSNSVSEHNRAHDFPGQCTAAHSASGR